ncbi:Yip1 family protein [Pinirhizobacter soli]|uniref:Yip1 family protein n=1 Tax=Pinirhizobacter soli TaxID=2786953 RepID=UPI00202A2025|nr:Yip1 family protein [Pinirhizobacter soli]
MDQASIVTRVKQILASPRTEWPLIAAEPATVKGLYLNYIVILAAIPAVAGFIRTCLIGIGTVGITIRTPIPQGIITAVFTYALSLLVVYVVALVINALASTFEGRQDMVQALKVVAYSYTAAWVGGAFIILPWLGWLVWLAGIVYSIYLMYLGMSPVMKNPPQKSAGYTALAVVIAVVLQWLVGLVLVLAIGGAAITAAGALSHTH